METNEEIYRIHSALIHRIAEACELDGDKKKAVEIGTAVAEYGMMIARAFSDDGKIDISEEASINEKARDLIDAYVPNVYFGWYNPVSWVLSRMVSSILKKIGG